MKEKIKTKIVCTIGPSSWTEEVIREMVDSGMTVARINGAFADINELERVEKLIRSVSSDVALMVDIKGHQVRLNKFESPIPIQIGNEVVIGSSHEDAIYPVTYPDLYKDLSVDDTILLDDGKVEMKVVRIENGKIYCEVIFGEILKPAKSVNVPGVKLSNPILTPRDIEQMKYCRENNWDFVAASFVRTAEDVRVVKKYLEGSHTKVIAKIEDTYGVENIDEILEEVEAIMVARGDMGVEMPFEKIPAIQKMIIKKCNLVGKAVITATHMLESMIEHQRPTRAEITDVANAVWDGTDAIMTSGETSGGKYPVQAVETMRRIALESESIIEPKLIEMKDKQNQLANASTRAAFEICESIHVDAVIVVSQTGKTAKLLGRYSLKQPIFAFVSDAAYKRRLMLSRGITKSFVYNKNYVDRDMAIKSIINEVLSKNLVANNSKVLVMGGGLKEGTLFPNIFEVVDLETFNL